MVLRTVSLVGIISLGLFFTAATWGAPGISGEKGIFQLVRVSGKDLATGTNTFDLRVADSRGRDVLGAQVTVTPWLPSGGHGVWEKPEVQELGKGYYRVDNLVLTRKGLWEIRVSVGRGAEHDTAVFTVAVGDGSGGEKKEIGRPGGRYQRTVETYRVPDVTLLNQDGKRVRLRSLFDAGRPVVVDFIYTTCTTICPVLSAGFSTLRARLGAEAASVHLVSISIDPEHDRPEEMKRYLARFGGGEGWDFLTGSTEDINLVMKAFQAAVPDKMSHKPLYILRAPRSSDWVRVSGLIGASDLLGEVQRVSR